MRFYQMSAEEVAGALSADVVLGKSIENIADPSESKAPFSTWIRGIFEEIKRKFLLIDLLPIVCYFITLIFSCLNQNQRLLLFSIGALLITLASYLGTGALIYSYRRRFQRRIDESRRRIRVIREGSEITVDPRSLILGDLILLEEGTLLYGDARIIEEDDLYADEQLVFSGSIPAQKTALAIAEDNLAPEKQTNMLWKGSYITQGFGRAIITALGEECYIEKTGGRDGTRQRSWFYNKQKNIGHIGSYLYIIFLALAALIALIATAHFNEALLLLGAMSAVVMLNPFSVITEWSYYRTAEDLFKSGALIRNIEAFDGMNRERSLYFHADEMLRNSLKLQSILPVDTDERSCLSHLALCLGNHSLSDTLLKPMEEMGIRKDVLDREFPVYRTDQDESGNVFSVFAGEQRSVVVAAGYWETMLPFISGKDDTLLEQIHSFEAAGKLVWLLSYKGIHTIPNLLNSADYEGSMVPMGIIVFDLIKKEKLAEKIRELRRSRMKVYLVNRFHKQFGEQLSAFYEMDGSVSVPPAEPCYSLLLAENNPNVVMESASPIMQENAKLVLNGNISPQDVIYRTKCMFCGIKRSIGFMICFGVMLIISALTLFLHGVPLEKILFPVLLLRPVLAATCYYLVETVGNCNQYKRSLLLGALCGLVGFIAAVLKFEVAVLSMMLSALLLCLVCLLTVRKMRALRKKDFLLLLIALLAAVFPWFFMEGNLLAGILFALFPPISSYIINLFY